MHLISTMKTNTTVIFYGCHKIVHLEPTREGAALGSASKIVQNAIVHKHTPLFTYTQKCRIHWVVVMLVVCLLVYNDIN